MIDLQIGQVVFSKAGRDKGLPFIIISIENNDKNKNSGYVYLSDGNIHKLSNPKKKKIKHIQSVNLVDMYIKDNLENGRLLDSDLRKALFKFNNK